MSSWNISETVHVKATGETWTLHRHMSFSNRQYSLCAMADTHHPASMSNAFFILTVSGNRYKQQEGNIPILTGYSLCLEMVYMLGDQYF